ncbi:GntR family transcriptional regulator [Paracoccus aerodenitrificans]|uniref:GntR family transcriptional regulator n=1 Tax=Paracoccus aerodenitrificans TaxID=3017781 RepID=UPI0022F0AA6E|nr:UTRA domain-containing protein [Paracoccus aerodenitrificans]
MSEPASRSGGQTSQKARNIADEARRRIASQEWKQGDRIPDEADLAVEFGVARATVNKALQLLADEGLLERRRRAGTRVVTHPVRKAVFEIPIIREQIEKSGQIYGYRVVSLRHAPPPPHLVSDLGADASAAFVHLQAVHYGDERPFQYEDRWINLTALPGMDRIDFARVNANEWLVRNATYLRADIQFLAENATERDAELLEAEPGQALLILSRATWNDNGLITSARIACQPGFMFRAAD